MMKMAGDLCSRSQTERLIWDQAQGIRRHSAQHQCHSRLGWSNSSWCSTVVQQELFITHSLFRTGTQPASKGGSYNWAWGQTTWSSIAGQLGGIGVFQPKIQQGQTQTSDAKQPLP
jgi:hypothetical protein